VSRHPRGLATLWFTEFWERFSYYGMRALLVLFMTAAPAQGGLGFTAAKAGGIYGLYTAFAYLSSLPGGWLADVFIGQRPAIVVGGIIIACGHFSMALPGLGGFYAGLVLVVIGTGLLKPNVSSMVGQLYPDGGARRDAAFSIFYMGINLGSFTAPLVTGFLGQRVNWHLGFGAAGVGMLVGVAQYLAGTKHLGTAGTFVRRAPRPISARAPLVLAIIAVGALSLLALAPIAPPSATTITSVGGAIVLGLPVAYFAWILTAGGLSPDERTRIAQLVCAARYRSHGVGPRDAGELVPVAERTADHSSRTGLRVALGGARRARGRAVRSREVRLWPIAHERRVRDHGPRRPARRGWPPREPVVARRHVCVAHDR
jgi:POT family proton-dependent oligopeptide transporter